MKLKENTDFVEVFALKFSVQKRMAFCATCCEKLFPDFILFVSDRDQSLLIQGSDLLETLWKTASMPVVTEEKGNAISQCLEISRKLEESPSICSDGAIQFLSCLYHAFMCMNNKNYKHMRNSSEDVLSYMENYLIAVIMEPPGYNILNATKSSIKRFSDIKNQEQRFYDMLRKLPLMENELESQRYFLNRIHKIPVLEPVFIKRIREISSTMGVQIRLRGLS